MYNLDFLTFECITVTHTCVCVRVFVCLCIRFSTYIRVFMYSLEFSKFACITVTLPACPVTYSVVSYNTFPPVCMHAWMWLCRERDTYAAFARLLPQHIPDQLHVQHNRFPDKNEESTSIIQKRNTVTQSVDLDHGRIFHIRRRKIDIWCINWQRDSSNLQWIASAENAFRLLGTTLVQYILEIVICSRQGGCSRHLQSALSSVQK